MQRLVAVALFLAPSRAYAAPCPDYATAERSVKALLDYQRDAVDLPQAYEALADAWSCTHPDARANDFVAWVRGVPSNQRLEATLHVHQFRSGQVLVLWARDDLPDGGRATLYGRSARWQRQASMTLDPSATPAELEPLGANSVLILEENRIPRVTQGSVRMLRVDGEKLVQDLFESNINNSKVSQRTAQAVTLDYEREPVKFSATATERNRFRLRIALSKNGPELIRTSLSPGLDILEQFCSAEAKTRRNFVTNADVDARLPSCQHIQVSKVRRPRPGTIELEIRAPLTCEAPRGSLDAVDDGKITLRLKGDEFRIDGLSRRWCRVLRARRDGDTF